MSRLLRNLALVAALCSRFADADDPNEVVLWPDGLPEPVVPAEPAEDLVTGADGMTRRFNVSRPRLFVHQPDASRHSGAAIVIVPGGGFGRLADEHEGSLVARWLTEHGVTAFQLAYRTPTNKQPNPVLGPAQDVQKAIRVIRDRADEWQIDSERIGVIGFSAGGQTALVAAASSSLIGTSDDAARLHPNALLLIYPYQVMDPATGEVRADVNLDAGLPPTFIAQAADDRSSDPLGSLLLFRELHARMVPCEVHVYENGGHGFGMRPRDGMPGSRDWSHRAIDWLRLRKFVVSESDAAAD